MEYCRKRKGRDEVMDVWSSSTKQKTGGDPFGGKLYLVNPSVEQFQKNFQNMQHLEVLNGLMAKANVGA